MAETKKKSLRARRECPSCKKNLIFSSPVMTMCESCQQKNYIRNSLEHYVKKAYRSLVARCTRTDRVDSRIYHGKTYCSQEDFVSFCTNNEHLQKLYNEWIESGYNKKLSPSVNRISSSGNYNIENIEWVTQSENIQLANKSRARVFMVRNQITGEYKEFIGLKEIATFFNVSISYIATRHISLQPLVKDWDIV